MPARRHKNAAFCAGFALALALAALPGCARKPDPAAVQSAATAAWTGLVNAWIESDLRAEPTMAASVGRHEYDGLLPDWSEAGLAMESQRLKSWRARAQAVDPAPLPEAQKFEREYLLAVIDQRLFWQVTADQPHNNPTWYYLDPALYLDRPYADLATRMQAYTRWASNVPAAAAQIKANLRGPLPKAYIDIGMYTFGPLADFLTTDVAKVFKGVGAGAAQAEFAKQNAAAAAALNDLQRHLETLRKTQTEDFALGDDLFAKMLQQTERVDTPIAAIEQAGLADLQRNEAALKEACASFAPGKSEEQCIAKSNTSKPEGGDFVGYARQQLVELKRFVEEKHIVTIPDVEQAEVKQAPPYNAQNMAYIDIPGPYEKNMPSFYNVAAPDPSWSKAKQLAYIPSRSQLLFISVHEVWPGHFLHFLKSNRAQSMIGKLYVGYAFGEGWAHYSEEMMWDEGLGDGDPEIHIGQLAQALLRDVRLLSAIGLHTKGMTLAESRRMFIEQGHQDAGNAEQQAARGAYDPAYLNYTMGKLMIRKLRADWCGKRGGAEDKACWHDFHDAFLSYGGPPIPLVRDAMLGEASGSAF
jgi:uncharacterized protein (DUF885 family)